MSTPTPTIPSDKEEVKTLAENDGQRLAETERPAQSSEYFDEYRTDIGLHSKNHQLFNFRVDYDEKENRLTVVNHIIFDASNEIVEDPLFDLVAKGGDLSKIERYIKAGKNIHILSKHNNQPLVIFAIHYGCIGVMRLLRNNGVFAPPYNTPVIINACLYYSGKWCDWETFQALIKLPEANPNLYIADTSLQKPIHNRFLYVLIQKSNASGVVALVARLRKEGVDINDITDSSNESNTPLCYCLLPKTKDEPQVPFNPNIISCLMENGARLFNSVSPELTQQEEGILYNIATNPNFDAVTYFLGKLSPKQDSRAKLYLFSILDTVIQRRFPGPEKFRSLLSSIQFVEVMSLHCHRNETITLLFRTVQDLEPGIAEILLEKYHDSCHRDPSLLPLFQAQLNDTLKWALTITVKNNDLNFFASQDSKLQNPNSYPENLIKKFNLVKLFLKYGAVGKDATLDDYNYIHHVRTIEDIDSRIQKQGAELKLSDERIKTIQGYFRTMQARLEPKRESGPCLVFDFFRYWDTFNTGLNALQGLTNETQSPFLSQEALSQLMRDAKKLEWRSEERFTVDFNHLMIKHATGVPDRLTPSARQEKLRGLESALSMSQLSQEVIQGQLHITLETAHTERLVDLLNTLEVEHQGATLTISSQALFEKCSQRPIRGFIERFPRLTLRIPIYAALIAYVKSPSFLVKKPTSDPTIALYTVESPAALYTAIWDHAEEIQQFETERKEKAADQEIRGREKESIASHFTSICQFHPKLMEGISAKRQKLDQLHSQIENYGKHIAKTKTSCQNELDIIRDKPDLESETLLQKIKNYTQYKKNRPERKILKRANKNLWKAIHFQEDYESILSATKDEVAKLYQKYSEACLAEASSSVPEETLKNRQVQKLCVTATSALAEKLRKATESYEEFLKEQHALLEEMNNISRKHEEFYDYFSKVHQPKKLSKQKMRFDAATRNKIVESLKQNERVSQKEREQTKKQDTKRADKQYRRQAKEKTAQPKVGATAKSPSPSSSPLSPLLPQESQQQRKPGRLFGYESNYYTLQLEDFEKQSAQKPPSERPQLFKVVDQKIKLHKIHHEISVIESALKVRINDSDPSQCLIQRRGLLYGVSQLMERIIQEKGINGFPLFLASKIRTAILHGHSLSNNLRDIDNKVIVEMATSLKDYLLNYDDSGFKGNLSETDIIQSIKSSLFKRMAEHTVASGSLQNEDGSELSYEDCQEEAKSCDEERHCYQQCQNANDPDFNMLKEWAGLLSQSHESLYKRRLKNIRKDLCQKTATELLTDKQKADKREKLKAINLLLQGYTEEAIRASNHIRHQTLTPYFQMQQARAVVSKSIEPVSEYSVQHEKKVKSDFTTYAEEVSQSLKRASQLSSKDTDSSISDTIMDETDSDHEKNRQSESTSETSMDSQSSSIRSSISRKSL